jgi:sensor histidine kinase YesM
MDVDFAEPEEVREGTSRIWMIGLPVILLMAVVLSVMTANECHSTFEVHHQIVSRTPSLIYGAVTWSWWVAVACALWSYGQKHPRFLRFSAQGLVRHGVLAVCLSVLHVTLLQWTIRAVSAHWTTWGATYRFYRVGTGQHYGIELVVYGFVYAFAGLLSLQSQNQHELFQKLNLQRQLSTAQLKALQMQMEPHFLFNTLNAIASLVAQHRNNEANRTLDHLNTILRATLRNAPAEKIPFHEEMKVIESFLAIQQIRFPEQLKVSLKVSSDTLDGLVPPFLLQPIIENAVCHGVAVMDSQGEIKTSADRIGDMLHLRVWNSAPRERLSHHEGHGIGQKNTRERLGHFYPGRHDFQAGHLADGAYEVSIIIPFETVMP